MRSHLAPHGILATFFLSYEKVTLSELVTYTRKINTYFLHFIGFLYARFITFKINQYSKWNELQREAKSVER